VFTEDGVTAKTVQKGPIIKSNIIDQPWVSIANYLTQVFETSKLRVDGRFCNNTYSESILQLNIYV
jgi:hypothetical protein